MPLGLLLRRVTASSIMSRAYIAFKSPEELATFSQNYDGHMFRDKQGACEALWLGDVVLIERFRE